MLDLQYLKKKQTKKPTLVQIIHQPALVKHLTEPMVFLYIHQLVATEFKVNSSLVLNKLQISDWSKNYAAKHQSNGLEVSFKVKVYKTANITFYRRPWKALTKCMYAKIVTNDE